jgi:hypothetical protein
MDATLMKADASTESMVSKSLYQQLPGTPAEFVERLWQENPEGNANTGEGQGTDDKQITTIGATPGQSQKATEPHEAAGDERTHIGTDKGRGNGKVNQER